MSSYVGLTTKETHRNLRVEDMYAPMLVRCSAAAARPGPAVGGA